MPSTVRTQRDRKRVSSRNSPWVSVGDGVEIAPPIADDERAAVEDADGVQAHDKSPFPVGREGRFDLQPEHDARPETAIPRQAGLPLHRGDERVQLALSSLRMIASSAHIAVASAGPLVSGMSAT